MGDFEKKFPASACRKKRIACSTNVIEKNSCTAVKKYPTHQVARKKKILLTINHPPPPPPQKLNGRPLSFLCLIICTLINVIMCHFIRGYKNIYRKATGGKLLYFDLITRDRSEYAIATCRLFIIFTVYLYDTDDE